MTDRISRRRFVGLLGAGAAALAAPRLFGADGMPLTQPTLAEPGVAPLMPPVRPVDGLLARPYLQPSAAAGVGLDSKDVLWVTEASRRNYWIEYGWDGSLPRTASIRRTELNLRAPAPDLLKHLPTTAPTTQPTTGPSVPPEVVKATGRGQSEQHYYKYSATLRDLPRGAKAWYRVHTGGPTGPVVSEQRFRTRAAEGDEIHFVAVGDMANGSAGAAAVSYQAGLLKPDFVLALGDVCYSQGRVSQYMDHFWNTYCNAVVPGLKVGSELMAGAPLYAMLGNHDVDTALGAACPDALGIYYFFQAPRTGPGIGRWSTPLGKDPKEAARFRAAAGKSYPSLGFYSFDEGPAHFTVLDSNKYVQIEDPALLAWIERDLKGSNAPWKIVCMHAPMFHTAQAHYTDQKMRVLSPLLERCGVDLVLGGHTHNYQRSRPLRFEPAPHKPKDQLIDGKFTIDTDYDGEKHTRAKGIVHVVSGGGGGGLYNDWLDKLPLLMRQKYGDNWAPFNARHMADRHCFVSCRVTPDQLTLSAIDRDGNEFDRAVMTKA